MVLASLEVNLTLGLLSIRYEGALDPWMSSLWRMVTKINPNFFPNGPDTMKSDTRLLDQPKVEITYHDVEDMDKHFSVTSGT